jgi:hypothetical protein
MSALEIVLIVIGVIILLSILLPILGPVVLGLICLGLIGLAVWGVISLISWLATIEVASAAFGVVNDVLVVCCNLNFIC